MNVESLTIINMSDNRKNQRNINEPMFYFRVQIGDKKISLQQIHLIAQPFPFDTLFHATYFVN